MPRGTSESRSNGSVPPDDRYLPDSKSRDTSGSPDVIRNTEPNIRNTEQSHMSNLMTIPTNMTPHSVTRLATQGQVKAPQEMRPSLMGLPHEGF